MIDLILAGNKDVVSREHAGTDTSPKEITTHPKLKLTDLTGHR